MDRRRYTQQQVMCGLREVWERMTGNDEPFTADTQIYSYMKSDGAWDDLDLADVFRGVAEFFGYEYSVPDLREFWGYEAAVRNRSVWEAEVAPRLTFGALADFIAARAPVVATFEPTAVFGRRCASAGIFDGIRQVASFTASSASPDFAPSTPIIGVLRGRELDRFWTQLRWRTEDSIPALPSLWREAPLIGGLIAFVLVVVSAGISAYASALIWLALGAAISLAIFKSAVAYQRYANPIPNRIVTFRDLTREIERAWSR